MHDAFGRAGIGLDDLDGIEVHDCFTPSEYLAIDHIGLTGPGESWKAIENGGEIEIGGRLPINRAVVSSAAATRWAHRASA